MSKDQIALSSLSMDLKRVALGYYRGSDNMAKRFLEEALKRKSEINPANVRPHIVKLLNKLDKLGEEKEKQKVAEDALMYSTLFQNASLR